MTITIGTVAHAGDATSGTALACAVTAVAGAGLVVFCQSGAGQNVTPTITDDQGNTYSQVGSVINNNNDNSSSTRFICLSVASANPTVTMTIGTAHTNRAVTVVPVTGQKSSAVTITGAGAVQVSPGTATDGVTTGNGTPNAGPGKAIAFAANSFNQALTAGTGWTDNGGAFSDWTTAVSCNTRVESKQFADTTAFAATWTQGGAGTGRTVSQAVFWPEGSTYTRPRGTVIAMLMAGIFAASLAPAPAPGPAPSPPPPAPSPAPPGGIGATADAGATSDPTVSPVTWNSSTTYTQGSIVNNGAGSYYMAWYDNLNVVLTNTTYWFPITRFYYVDSAAGNDANTGDPSPSVAKAAPLQTAAKIEDYLNSGGTVNAVDGACVLFKRGQAFFGALTVTKTCVIGNWGTGALPTLSYRMNGTSNSAGSVITMAARCMTIGVEANGDLCTMLNVNAGCTLVDGDVVSRASDGRFSGVIKGTSTNNRIVIKFDDPANAYNANHTNSSGFQLATNDVLQTAGGAHTGTLSSNSATPANGIVGNANNTQVLNCVIRDMVGNGTGCGSTGTRNSADNFHVKNCFIYNTCKWSGNGAGGQGGWGSFIKVIGNTAYDNGTNGNGSHNFYLDDLDDSEFAFNWCYMTGAFGNHGLVVHGQCARLDIHDNLIEYSQSGIGLNDGYFGAWLEGYDTCNIYRNTIRFCGFYNGAGLILDIKCNTNCKYFNNLAYGCKSTIGIAPYNVSFNAANATVGLVFAYNTFVSDTTVGAGDYFFKFISVSGVSVGAGCAVRNNLIESQRNSLPTFSTDAGTSTSNIDFRNNLIYNITGYSNVIRWAGTSYTLAGWAAATGINSNTTNVTTTNYAGVFTNKAGNVYTLASGSPAKGIGVFDATIVTDITGASRSGTNPSAGCYE